jgi:hypothetical protein
MHTRPRTEGGRRNSPERDEVKEKEGESQEEAKGEYMSAHRWKEGPQCSREKESGGKTLWARGRRVGRERGTGEQRETRELPCAREGSDCTTRKAQESA